MCGRYTVDPKKIARLVRLLSLPLPHFAAHYGIYPTQTVPVIRDRGAGPEWAMMRWGLIPHWAKEPQTGYSTFNARVETAAHKPAFREPWAHRRCIVPATGFYEWQATEHGKKQPWFFESADGEALALAGLWDHWTDDQQVIESCTILVGPPDPVAVPIHDRSPVILGDTAIPLWISPLLKKPDIQRVIALPHGGLRRQMIAFVADDGLHPISADS
jgi:putative SOS response-associated peptidase YedK